MVFPVSKNSSIQVASSTSIADLLRKVEYELLAQKADEVSRDGNEVRFTAGFFRFVSNWNMLSFIREGRIRLEVNGSNLIARYSLSFGRYYVVITLMVFGFLGYVLFGGSNVSISEGLLIILFAWGWLFGINYLIATVRFRSWLSQIVTEDIGGSREPAITKLQPFNPAWQPEGMKAMTWRKKFLILAVIISVLNVVLLLLNAFPLGIDWPLSIVFFVGGLLALPISAYLIGRSLDKWNLRVNKVE